MNQQAILTVLRLVGMKQEVIDNTIKYGKKKLEDAAAGKPVTFNIRTDKLGRCYNGYTDVVVNYTGADEEKPCGMTGRVPPNKTGEIENVKWATFYYDIDSSD